MERKARERALRCRESGRGLTRIGFGAKTRTTILHAASIVFINAFEGVTISHASPGKYPPPQLYTLGRPLICDILLNVLWKLPGWGGGQC